MNPDSIPEDRPASKGRLESAGFYVFLATLILAPLAFLPTPYISVDLVKACLIALGTLVSAIIYGILAIRERRLALPPRSMVWMGGLIGVSLVISSLLSSHAGKAFFGEAFEITTASFLLISFLGALIASVTVMRRPERAIVAYVGIVAAFFVIYVYQGLRLIFGAGFASFGLFASLTSSLLNNWYDLGTYSLLVVILALSALAFLPLSRRMKTVYWLVLALAALSAFLIGIQGSWAIAALVFLGVAIYLSLLRHRPDGPAVPALLKRIAWIPAIAFVVAALFVWRGGLVSGPVQGKLGVSYSETVLPWQMTLDVASGAIKDHPLFGVGPNHFTQAFLSYKPAGINQTDAWGLEFPSGFSLISTFVVTQGLVGTILWILFFVFLGILSARTLRNLPEKPHERFILVSSWASAVFLWGTLLVSVPSHVILFYAFVMTGIFAGASAAYGSLSAWNVSPPAGSRSYKSLPSVLALLVALAAVWAVFYAKDFIAMAYFGSGVKELTASNQPLAADADFQKALAFNHLDVFWQARAEAGLAEANQLISSVNQGSSASTSQAVAVEVSSILNQSFAYASSAVAYDPSDYYNYISEARVSSLAASIQMNGAYQSAVTAYGKAIALDPQNPSLYLDLAQLEAVNNQLDDAMQTVGQALQVKSNYLDAIYLLSEIEAAQGNLKDAITATQVAIQIDPAEPILFFQLGLLEYTNLDYADAIQPLETAISLEKDYANAQYFLGLSYARLGQDQSALTQFKQLAATNPDNQQVAEVLGDLEAGVSPFAGAAAPAAAPSSSAASVKSSHLPIEPK